MKSSAPSAVAAWRPTDIPDLSGKKFLVTGTSTGGLGYFTTRALADAGACVLLADRHQEKLEETDRAIRAEVPGADLDQIRVDLTSFESVRLAADRVRERFGPIDVLVNNAGVMAPPRGLTEDGLETQLATNHFGPFLLTGLLLPDLVASGAGRVVVVSSQFSRFVRRPPLTDPFDRTTRYRKWTRYGQSKLANLLFVNELRRRCDEAALPIRVTAAHPGFAGTHLAANGQYGRTSGGAASILDAAIKAVSQSAEAGSWPTLMAATADLPSGSYCGPSGRGELAGPPKVTAMRELAHDPHAARELWKLSEKVTGLQYP